MDTKRYFYHSKESIEDSMLWAGFTKEEIEKRLANFTPRFYDKIDKVMISVEEYNKRKCTESSNI